jgi:NAD-dependent deacetylase
MAPREALSRARERVGSGASVAVLSGAGISAASGIPTFRSAPGSLWSKYRPEQLATPQAFAADPELVWRWYDWRRGLIARAAPNAAHLALAAMERQAPVTLITQNVDGYHQRAGSTHVLEYHGSIWTVRCTACARETRDERVPIPCLPRCGACGGLLRPGVVWFGETIDPAVMLEAEQAASECDLFLVIGTAGVVYPAAGLVAVAREADALVVEFNCERSAVSQLVDIFIAGSAAETVPQLVPTRTGK